MYRACPSDRGRTARLPSRISSSPGLIRLRTAQRGVDQLADVIRGNRLPRAINRPQALEDPLRLLDPGGISLDPDLAVPGKNLDTHRVANLPEKLVSTAEDRELFGMTLQADCHFRHA